MAATGTPTPNIGLRRAKGTDPASVDDINYNSELLDTKLGAVGSTSVQAQINALSARALKKTTKTGTTSSNGNININMGTESYDIIAVSYVSGIAIPYKANDYEWLVHVMNAELTPVASAAVSLDVIYTNK